MTVSLFFSSAQNDYKVYFFYFVFHLALDNEKGGPAYPLSGWMDTLSVSSALCFTLSFGGRNDLEQWPPPVYVYLETSGRSWYKDTPALYLP